MLHINILKHVIKRFSLLSNIDIGISLINSILDSTCNVLSFLGRLSYLLIFVLLIPVDT